MKRYLFLFVFLFFISFVSSTEVSLGTFPLNENVSLTQLCGNCSYNNLTSVKYPNGTNILTDVVMTKRGSEFNYTLIANYTGTIGAYTVNGIGDLDGEATSWAYTFEINPLGLASTDARVNAANRGVYVIFAVAILFFIIFMFTPKESMEQDEMGNLVASGNNRPFKWTFFLLGVLFLTVGFNLTFISIYNDIGDNSIGAVYDKLAMGSSYMFYIAFGLLLFLWVFTSLANLADKKRMKQARETGTPTNFDQY